MSAPEAAAQSSATWDEAQCTAALAQLEQLQSQIDGLRLAIPRIIDPFHRPLDPSTFKLYAKGVLTSQSDIKNLHESWKTPEMQRTLEHVKESFSANPDLSASASIPSFGWVERHQKGRDTKERGSNDVESTWKNLTEDEVSRAIEDFRNTYPTIKVDSEDHNSRIHIQLTSGCANLKFRIGIDRDSSGRHKLTAECIGTKEPSLTVSKCLAIRPKANDLKYLLDMIAAYKTVKGLSCAKCKQLLDKFMLTPLARRSMSTNDANEAPQTVWEAFHESCL